MPSSDSNTVTLAVIGILATTVAGLIWTLKFLFTRLLPIIEKAIQTIEKLDTRENQRHKELIKAIRIMTEAKHDKP